MAVPNGTQNRTPRYLGISDRTVRKRIDDGRL
jgi:hypothetical protein